MSRLDIEEVTKTTIAVVLVWGTFALAFYQYPTNPPKPNPDKSMRLLIVPTRPLHLNKQENVALFVVDRYDAINRSRDDAVELSLNEKSNSSIGGRTPSGVIWEKHLTIRLHNGTAEFMLLGRSPEFAVISAYCIERDPPTTALISSLAIGLEEG